MESSDVYYLPLMSAIIETADAADSELVREKHRSPSFFMGENPYVALRFFDASIAQEAESKIAAYREIRVQLGFSTHEDNYGLEVGKNLSKWWKEKNPQTKDIVYVRDDDFNPKEHQVLIEDIRNTRLRFFPVTSKTISSMKQFVGTYSLLEVLRLAVVPPSEEQNRVPYERFVSELHECRLDFTRQVLNSVLDRRPIHITIDGNTTKLNIIVDGSVKKLSPTQVRGMAALVT